MKTLIFFVAFISFSVVNAVDHPDVGSTTFCYSDAACGPNSTAWTGMCNTGRQQSPININLTVTSYLPTQSFKRNKAYESKETHRFFGQNNGHSVQFEMTRDTDELKSRLKIWNGGLNDTYKFAQLHFHWGRNDTEGSEHTINGTAYPMELHIVHYRDNYSSLAKALAAVDDREAVAVMAILYRVVKTGEKNLYINSIVEAVAQLSMPKNKVTKFKLPLNLYNLYPKNAEYVRYLGSLTTPTCDEKVIWTVFLNPVEIHEDQMFQFRTLRNAEMVSASNYRPVQPLYGRTLQYFRG